MSMRPRAIPGSRIFRRPGDRQGASTRETASRNSRFVAAFFLLAAALSVPVFAGGSREAEMIPAREVARGGFCVIIGAPEKTELGRRLVESGPWVVHWLDSGREAVEEARGYWQGMGMYGGISVERREGPALPYTDNLVNLLIVLEDAGIDRGEKLRVMAPGGRGVVFGEGDPELFEKPRPEGMGEWTHPWQDAGGTLASSERLLEPPNAFQWVAGPRVQFRSRKANAGAILSSGGRLFMITRDAAENFPRGGPDYLVARDAFSGVVLWSREWEGALSRAPMEGYHQAIAASPGRVYAGREEDVAVYGAACGELAGAFPVEGRPGKLLLGEGVLVVQTPEGLTAFDTDAEERMWHRAAEDPRGALLGEGRVFYLSGARRPDGRWEHDLHALDLGSGEELWKQPGQQEHGHYDTAKLRLHFAGEGIVGLIERDVLRILSAEDGRELWSYETEAEARGFDRQYTMDSRQVGHFLTGGRVWIRDIRASFGRTSGERWLAKEPLTGEAVRELTVSGQIGVTGDSWGNVNKISCQPLTATADLVLDARLSTAWDFESGRRSGFKFARGGCTVGMIPADGMAYVPPNACGCLAEQLRGYLALVHSRDEGLERVVPSGVEEGPAYGEFSPAGGDSPGWPSYRRDGRRGSWLPERVEPGLEVEWRADAASGTVDDEWRVRFGRSLTPPVAAEGMVLVAEPHAHRVIALDWDSGEELWSFTAGGRVTVPPTVYGGLALFGAGDGYVYALRLSDGEISWRRRAAPSDRRIMAYGQAESAWPVKGGVLVHEGLAIAAAGRAADADGGVVVKAFDPRTGLLEWQRRVEGAAYGMPDLLVTDGEHVYLMDMQIDPETGEVSGQEFQYRPSDRGGSGMVYPEGVRYLRGGMMGILDSTWTSVSLALRKMQSAWSWGDGIEGEILAFTDETGFSFHLEISGREVYPMFSGAPSTEGGGRVLAQAVEAADVGRRALMKEPSWIYELPGRSQVEAMLIAENVLFVSGPSDRGEPFGEGFLVSLDARRGRELERVGLPAAPVHDGLAAADGRIFAVLKDGSVVCLSGE